MAESDRLALGTVLEQKFTKSKKMRRRPSCQT
jgi:hypothetical protein